jgi:hypothetical protein
MTYHSLSECTLTADERRAEMSRICTMLDDSIDQMQDNERRFITQMSDGYAPVSVKQIFWARDLKDKYL